MVNYDGKTENGIPYVTRLYTTSYKYQVVVDDLDALAPQKKDVMGGGSVSAYTIGNRSITKNQLSANDVIKRWDKLMAEKQRIENGTAPRKAVAVVHRDW